MILNFLHIIIEDDQTQMFSISIQIVIHSNELHCYFDIGDVYSNKNYKYYDEILETKTKCIELI